MRENPVKIKLLVLYELLRNDSDAEQPLTTNSICAKMKEQGIFVDRRTLADDINVLRKNGYPVMITKIGRQNGYYLEQEKWKVADLRVMMDAIYAASFIPVQETGILVEKILALARKEDRNELERSKVAFNNVKHSNHDVQDNISIIGKALGNRKKVSFLYYDLNEHLQRQYRRDGERYVVEPIALIYDSDFYYLMTYNSHYDNVTNYRIDKIADPREESEDISKMALHQIRAKKPERFRQQAFRMFGGKRKRVILDFSEDIIGAVIDKFGEGIRMTRDAETNRIHAIVDIEQSQVWNAWLNMFGEKMRVLNENEQ